MRRSLPLGSQAVSEAYGIQVLRDGLSLRAVEGEQAGLVGPDGFARERERRQRRKTPRKGF